MTEKAGDADFTGLVERLEKMEALLEHASAAPDTRPFPVLVNIEDACLILGRISRASVYRLIENGRLESVKIAGRRLITLASMRYMLRIAGLRHV